MHTKSCFPVPAMNPPLHTQRGEGLPGERGREDNAAFLYAAGAGRNKVSRALSAFFLVAAPLLFCIFVSFAGCLASKAKQKQLILSNIFNDNYA